jgi:hypothetical protein
VFRDFSGRQPPSSTCTIPRDLPPAGRHFALPSVVSGV